LVLRTYMLAPADQDALARLAQDATEEIRWTISGSAVLRALIRAASQDTPWVREHVYPLIMQAIAEGSTVWGYQSRLSRPQTTRKRKKAARRAA
jgi:hypothetical protein